MDPFFRACFDANIEIARYIDGGLSPHDRAKGDRGAGGDISSGIDLKAEEIFIKHLARFGKIDSEESGLVGEGESNIIIDPIDGSSNLLSNFPYYGTSVALIDEHGKSVMAVICNLASREIFFKQAGRQPSGCKLSGGDLLDMDMNLSPETGIFERAYRHPYIVDELGKRGLKFRAPGAVALSLVYARYTRFFLYVGEYRSYDFAGGLLFCEDLEVDVNDQYVIVSQEKKTLHTIEAIVLQERKK